MPAPPLLRSAAVLSDPARLRALRRSGLLDPSADAVLDRYTRMASRLLETPVALLSLVEPERQVFKSRVGLDVSETALSHSFCQHVVAADAPLVIEDAREHPLVRANEAIADLGVVAYAGSPVRAPNGEPLGSFCAIASQPRVWSDDDVRVIEELAAAVSSEIALRIRTRRSTVLAQCAILAWVSADDAGNVFEVSPSWENVTGRTADQSLDADWTQAIHPDDRERVRLAWEQAAPKQVACVLDCRLLDAKGDALSVRLYGTPVLADTRAFTEYVGAIVDVS